jgi:hypothetical protein
MAAEPHNPWHDFAAQTRPGPASDDDVFERLASMLRGRPRAVATWLGIAHQSRWFPPAALFLAALQLASLPAPAGVRSSSFWRVGRSSLGVLLHVRAGATVLIVGALATLALFGYCAVRDRSAPAAVQHGLRFAGTTALLAGSGIWLLVIAFAIVNAAVAVFLTALTVGAILAGLFFAGRAVAR